MSLFASPLALLLLLTLPLIGWRLCRRCRVTTIFAPLSRRLPAHGSTWRTRLLGGVPYLYLLGLASLIIAAAGPQKVDQRTGRHLQSIAIEMAVDISGSMRGLDLSPSRDELKTRLDVVKETFADFVQSRPDDLIGLVTFAGYASTRVPLTADHEVLLHVLSGVRMPDEEADNAEDALVSRDENMTAIGDGLATAIARLESAEPKSKIVILLSDGENNFGAITPHRAAEAAKELGIRVYTIGVGSSGMVPYWTGSGIARGMLTLDETTLQAIAQTTGGLYANVTSKEALQQALDEIAKLEETDVERQIWRHATPRYRPWLIGGLLLLTIACLLSLAFRRAVI